MNVAGHVDHLCAFGCEGDVALEGWILVDARNRLEPPPKLLIDR